MEIPYELLIKYCKKQTTPEENQQAERWISEGDNLSVFLDLKKEWRYINNSDIVMPDKFLTWRKIQTKTYRPQKNKSKQYNLYLMGIAASIAFVLGFTVFYYFGKTYEQPIAEQFTTINSTEKSKIELADGTNVWLNSGSHMVLGSNYNTYKREINADGELFFDVVQSDKKFIINIEKIRVEVLGTSFNLKTSGIDNNVEISLIEGIVAVYNSENGTHLFTMDSAQHAIINKNNFNFTIKDIANASLSNIWIKESLIIYNEPLENVIEKLENWYGIQIICTGLDMKKRYTFHIENENLNDFMEIFSVLIPVEYNINGKKLYITVK